MTSAERRAMEDIKKATRHNRDYPSRTQYYVESIYPIAAARCAAKGWLDRIEQSETCRPNRRRYFSEYRLTPMGAAALSQS